MAHAVRVHIRETTLERTVGTQFWVFIPRVCCARFCVCARAFRSARVHACPYRVLECKLVVTDIVCVCLTSHAGMPVFCL